MPEPRTMFEDFLPGEIVEYGDVVVDRDAMVAFAQEYDPQPMHLSEDAARTSMLGALIGSGWYSAVLMMRMTCDGFLLDAASLGAPGIESLEWRAPVRAGDRLRVRRATLEARPSKSRPEMGLVKFCFELVNQRDEVAMRQTNVIMFGRRTAGTA